MDRQQTLRSTRSGSSLKTGRRVYSPRLWILAVVVALTLTSAAYGQEECLSKCQQQLSTCLEGVQGDPVATSICQDNYDTCCIPCNAF